MSLLRLAGVSRYYGSNLIFGPVDLSVHAGDRIGLIGPNGSGKSSLLEILAGAPADSGTVVRARDLVIGYLRQEGSEEAAGTLYEYVASALASLDRQEEELRALERRMADPALARDEAALAALMEAYARKTAAFEQRGGYEKDARIRGALFGLGFSADDFDRPFQTLSGGQRARARLAHLLLSDANLLLLDEPTNHLDLAATQWLQGFLARDPRAFVLVSHDRGLLNALPQVIWEMDAKTVRVYRGNYAAAREQAAAWRERQLKEHEQMQKERERLEAFVRKWRAGTRAAQAKSRARKLEKMDWPEPPPAPPPRASFTVPTGVRSERRVCTLVDVAVGHGDRPVVAGINLEIVRGQRIGIAGPNGSGKSTLLRTLAGELPPLAGIVDFGRGVRTAYYAQHRWDLNPERTVLEETLAQKDQQIGEARAFLARFLFRGDDVNKRVAVLSGGEKSRLALAKLLLGGGNFLLLDEPSNHLDIGMAEALEEALSGYEGTLVVVTHDRALLAALVDVIWWVEGGRLTVIDGGYAGLEAWLAQRQAAEEPVADSRGGPAAPGRRAAPSPMRGAASRPETKTRRAAQRRLAEVEREIEALVEEREALEQALANPDTYRRADQARAATARHEEVVQLLAEREAEWAQLVDILAALEGSEAGKAASKADRPALP